MPPYEVRRGAVEIAGLSGRETLALQAQFLVGEVQAEAF